MTYAPDTILTIKSTIAPKGRRFTVVSSSCHRTILRGSRGGHRVLVEADGEAWIYEDDGEKNRGRPCEVVAVVEPETIEVKPPEPRQVAHARVMLTEWGEVATANRDKGAEALAEALTLLVSGDLRGACLASEKAARSLRNALAFEYVARTASK